MQRSSSLLYNHGYSMEQVFFMLHQRVIDKYRSVAQTARQRRTIECTCLLLAIGSLTCFIMLHYAFISNTANASANACFEQYRNVEQQHTENRPKLFLNHDIVQLEIYSSIRNNSSQLLPIFNVMKLSPTQSYPIQRYKFSLEKGYLALPDTALERHAVTKEQLRIPENSKCFGGDSFSALVRFGVGYDTIVMNNFIKMFNGSGYLINTDTFEMFNLNYASDFNNVTLTTYWGHVLYKIGILATLGFLFFTTTSLVAYTLRETQSRMLKFTYILQYQIRNRLPYGKLVMTHVVESLVFVPIMVGILFFLFEFFKDQVLAFMILSLVWLCELFSVVCVRTETSALFFPKLFFVYFAGFHVYFFAQPFGFSYSALLSMVLFLLHNMFYFINNCEIPALDSGRVSAADPREIGPFSDYDGENYVAGASSVPARDLVATPQFSSEDIVSESSLRQRHRG